MHFPFPLFPSGQGTTVQGKSRSFPSLSLAAAAAAIKKAPPPPPDLPTYQQPICQKERLKSRAEFTIPNGTYTGAFSGGLFSTTSNEMVLASSTEFGNFVSFRKR